MYATLGIIACMMMVPLLFRLAATVTTTIPEDYRACERSWELCG